MTPDPATTTSTSTATSIRVLDEGWAFREVDPGDLPHSDLAEWVPAVVPGHVHLDLMRTGAIPDPFDRMHERGVQWVDDADWAYRCTFEVAAEELAGARHVLRFEGLDTIATVLLNGAEVLATENMLVEHEVEVTAGLQAGENELEVRFTSAERVASARQAAAFALDPSLEGHRLGLLSRSFLRKAQYAWGWDWGPRLRSCGIWRDVLLVRIPVARISDWWWRARFDGDACEVAVQADADGSAEQVRVALAGRTVTGSVGQPIAVPVDEPQRWWPNGFGDPHLYDLRVELLAGGEVVDTRDARIGLREVELVTDPDPDGAGSTFHFRVNGVPIFAKGANWIPDDSFPSRTTHERIRAVLDHAVEAHMNMIRIWGGGLYETPEFDDTCDELGLLVWQDFAFACAMYPETDEWAVAIEAEARAAVRRIRNHTSLALWCGNNENQWLVAMVGLAREDGSIMGDRWYQGVLPDVVAAEDPQRPYWPSSPFGTGPDPSGDHDGDCHYWNVWHGEGDWLHYDKCSARFVSEFGFSGPPDLLTLEEHLDPADLGVDTPGMRWHDKTGKGYSTYLGYIALHYPMPATVEDLVYYGQLNQADAMRYGIERFRRLRPHTMGTLVWQLNDCWPVQSWAWVDSRLRPKAAWHAARRFYAPLLLSLWRDGDQVHAHLVNDSLEPWDGVLELRAVDHDGNVLWSTTTAASVAAGGSTEVLATELPADVREAADHAVVHGTFADVESTLLLVEPKDLRLRAPRIAISAVPEGAGARLTLESSTLALSVVLSLADADGRWSDNVLHLLPGEPRQVLLTSPDGLSYDELVSAVRWRAL
jgi:beta-mannosidase